MSGNVLRTSQWQVIAYAGKNRNVMLGRSYVRAASESQAMELGKTALRLIGVRGRFCVQAVPYAPWTDWAFAGFIVRVK